jgi:gamma-glutamylcyclotransferase (GGCT)/AIG2-like uncharacterized protein YtfP
MASRTAWYFAYGGNMSSAQMRARVGNVLEEHTARLPNYELRFNKKVRGGSGGANVQPAQGKAVYGVLYKIEESAFRSLDRFEGVPQHYRRIEVRVTPDGGAPVLAQVYIATKVEKGLRAATHDLQLILASAAERGLPQSYLDEIKASAGAA